VSEVPDTVRKQLYALTKTSGRNRVLDLGNLRNGPTAKDTILRLKEVLAYLMEKGILPIIVGGTHDMCMGQYLGYELLNKHITMLNIDARLDIHESEDSSASFLANIFKHDPNYLFNYIQLGYQTYFVDEQELVMLEKLYFEAHRLGEFKNQLPDLEPIIRDADMLSVDMTAIQNTYCPDTTQPNLFGYTGEEICQIAWYAGHNDKLSSFGLYNLTSTMEGDFKSSFIAATMIWYFIDGYYHRKGDKNFMSNDYMIYEVALGGNPDSIRFYKSKLSEKWWMEISDDNSDSVFLRNKMIPCNYADYELAQTGEIPQRWVNAIAKIG
jgi:formiminoglutamase